ncbi:hypothetical protein [Methanoplanus endosymbiosus]|uniref:Uncharacterized protein n=1 Tax=Methanoplanus endosymbiosus TaxID=33865 RepID=A0A9E7TIE3_9EURY|nr:hypothetical protein [Methanoplanus endosymbiosus]UUX92323.1 hypothetical protein L6E24_13440 [Methanoplanus endosymbiosus]
MLAISASGTIFGDNSDEPEATDVLPQDNSPIAEAADNSTITRISSAKGVADRFNLIYERPEESIKNSVETDAIVYNNTFAATVASSLTYERDSYLGPGKYAENFSIKVIDLIPDTEIINTEYLGHEKGIIIDVNYNSGDLNTLQNTIWTYEVDATQIFTDIFESDYSNDVAFLFISFTDTSGREGDVVFKMVAEDAMEFSEYPKPGYYVEAEEWTDFNISADTGIKNYEDPATKFEFTNKRDYSDKVEVLNNIYTKEEVKSYIAETSKSLSDMAFKIMDYANDKDWQNVGKYSEAMTDSISEHKTKLNEGIMDDESLYSTIENATDAYEIYKTAAMNFWYGSYYYDSTRIIEGVMAFQDAVAAMNAVNEELEIEDIVDEERLFSIPVPEMLPKSYKLTESYVYRDSSGTNDISIKIEDFKTVFSYYTKSITEDGPLVKADYGKKFFVVTVDITHMGYRGGGTDNVRTPSKSVFKLNWNNQIYTDSTPSDYIVNMGIPYSTKSLGRREHFESVLLFEVPEEFYEERAYIEVNLGGTWGKPTWDFEMLGS